MTGPDNNQQLVDTNELKDPEPVPLNATGNDSHVLDSGSSAAATGEKKNA